MKKEDMSFEDAVREVFCDDPYKDNIVDPFMSRMADERYETLQAHSD